MPVINICSLNDERVSIFSSLTETQLRNKLEPEKGLFIVESPKVIDVALNSGYTPVAMLCEEKHIHGDASKIIDKCESIAKEDGCSFPVYTGKREILSKLTGYTLTRGVLCAMRRQESKPMEQICHNAQRLVVINGVVDTTNIGAIFRAAAALGIDGILLTPNSCDPLNRRAVRVSMGSVFLVPWTWMTEDLSSLHDYGFKTAAMALTKNSILLDNPILKSIPRLAVVMGTEGDGLPQSVIAEADYVVRIPMSHNVDSLNVASAAAVAFWELRTNK